MRCLASSIDADIIEIFLSSDIEDACISPNLASYSSLASSEMLAETTANLALLTELSVVLKRDYSASTDVFSAIRAAI